MYKLGIGLKTDHDVSKKNEVLLDFEIQLQLLYMYSWYYKEHTSITVLINILEMVNANRAMFLTVDDCRKMSC